MTTAAELFEVLVRENADALSVFVRGIASDAQLADEVFQETLVTAWEKIDSYDRERPFGAWLRGIARNLLLRHSAARASGVRSLDPVMLDALAERCADAQSSGLLGRDARLDALDDCLDALPARYRAAIDHRYMGALRGQRLASRLAMSWEATKKTLQRARAQLHRCIEQRRMSEEAAR